MYSDTAQYPHSDLTQKIIGAAMAVHRELGPGLNESIYENALCIELTSQQLNFTQQQQFNVSYQRQHVGTLIVDMIVEGKVLIEAKVASAINDLHVAQTLSYLSISGLAVGLVLNFRNQSLQFKRVANTLLKNQ